MSIFTVVVSSPPTSTLSLSAYKFCQALLAKQHTLSAVFFYADGCHNANRLIAVPNDEENPLNCWQTLAEKYQVNLVNCSTSAARRGVISAKDTEFYEVDTANMADRFNAGGLGELIAVTVKSDRVVQF